MRNFDYCNPSRILFGEGQISAIQHHIPQHSRIMLLYGCRSALESGTVDEVKTALGQRSYSEAGGIVPQPRCEMLQPIIEQVRHERIDFLLAIGGSSVIDATKFIAAAAVSQHSPHYLLDNPDQLASLPALPLGTVLTLPGTGSEMNSQAMISSSEDKLTHRLQSDHFFPLFSVLDPTKTYLLPSKLLSNSLITIFSQIASQYFTYPACGMVQDHYAESLLRTLIEVTKHININPHSYTLRANMMWLATQAGNGLLGAGVPVDHSVQLISHAITTLYDIDYARALAIILPAQLAAQQQQKRAKLLQCAERVWNIQHGQDGQKLDNVLTAIHQFFHNLNVPTQLRHYGLGREAIADILQLLKQHRSRYPDEHKFLSPDSSLKILLQAM